MSLGLLRLQGMLQNSIRGFLGRRGTGHSPTIPADDGGLYVDDDYVETDYVEDAP